jgi:hypothetical protein
MRLSYFAESCICPDDKVRANKESAKAQGTRQHLLADGRTTGETGRRAHSDPPRKAEHGFL